VDILLLEPYLSGSHAAWAEGYAAHSQHKVTVLSLPGRFWKWRMHGGAVTLARKFLTMGWVPDCLLATDMLDLATFLALTRSCTANIPAAIYFHENQLSYPWASHDRDRTRGHDIHYGFINYISALAADAVFFNSAYHRESFFAELPRLLKHFPDYNELDTITELQSKSGILPLGLDLARFDAFRPASEEGSAIPPIILWNHRWEYDKNPCEFFEALYTLADQGLDFRLVILGECLRERPDEFLEARARLGERVLHMGYVPDFGEYARWLWRANILPVTSHHDFFGSSVVEAIYCGCFPLLPRRLSYPELIPPQYHTICLYRDLPDLVERLRCLITAASSPAVAPLQAHVARFDWHILSPEYDARFETLCHRQKGDSR